MTDLDFVNIIGASFDGLFTIKLSTDSWHAKWLITTFVRFKLTTDLEAQIEIMHALFCLVL